MDLKLSVGNETGLPPDHQSAIPRQIIKMPRVAIKGGMRKYAINVPLMAINGTFIAYFRIPPFIATLGIFMICRGIALWWSGGNPVSFPTESFKSIGSGMMPVFWFLSLAVIFHFILKYTVYGKHTYAIGQSRKCVFHKPYTLG